MTTQEKLKEIEQQIRKDIPRLMKSTEGCLIKYDNEVYKIVKYSGEFNLIVYQGESDVLQPLTKRIHEYSIPSEDIIGHEIMLNDVLEWLEYMRKHHDLCDYIRCDVSDKIFQIAVACEIADVLSLHGFKEECEILKWDLSKLLLKDQSEELINFLYNLINQ